MSDILLHCTCCEVIVNGKDWKEHTDTPKHRAFREAHYYDPMIFDSHWGTKAYLVMSCFLKIPFKKNGYRVKKPNGVKS